MSVTELQVQEGLQDIFQGMSEFATDSVVINDWTVLDGEVGNAPYAIIRTADSFRARQDASSTNATWQVLVGLYVDFQDWDTTLNEFRAVRQSIIDTMNTGNNRSAGGYDGFTIDEIRNQGPIVEYYDPSTAPENLPFATPMYLFQWMVFEGSEF